MEMMHILEHYRLYFSLETHGFSEANSTFVIK
jgi:hypothetical protein